MNTRRFTGEYAPNGKEVRNLARQSVGGRCVRCGHPYQKGTGGGEWSPCDKQCTHGFPVRRWRASGWADEGTITNAGLLVRSGLRIEAKWRILTVHHFDGDKANDAWWNLMPLCQRCHLAVQSKVDPRLPYFLEHSEWAKPYVAGFYAMKYEGLSLTREQAIERLEDLLKYERIV